LIGNRHWGSAADQVGLGVSSTPNRTLGISMVLAAVEPRIHNTEREMRSQSILRIYFCRLLRTTGTGRRNRNGFPASSRL
jgi:hypothetical protein